MKEERKKIREGKKNIEKAEREGRGGKRWMNMWK